MIQARSLIGVDESDTIPSFGNALFDNIRGKDCGVPFISPQVIGAEICEYKDGAGNGYDREPPVRPQLTQTR